jgi:hypothetical protein
MVTRTQAENTLSEVRAFYKHDLKSSNKAYINSSFGLTLSNNNISQSRLISEANRAKFKGKTPYQIGAYLHRQRNGARAGNCGEMAAVAVYLAIKNYNVSMDEAFLWTLTAPGGLLVQGGFGHSVAFLGDETAKQNGWLVDPWCNLCCSFADYRQALNLKLLEWKTEGKRIMVPGLRGGWLEPTHQAITGILAANSKFFSLGAETPTSA